MTRAKLKRSKDTTVIQEVVSGEADSEVVPDAKKAKPEDSKSLDQFLFKYHSEDDAAFEEILDKSVEEQRRNHTWLYEKEREYQSSLPLPSSQDRLAITDGSETTSDRPIGGECSGVRTWDYTAKNTLMYIPEGVVDSVNESMDKSIKRREIVHSNTRLSRDFMRKTSAALAQAAEGEDAPGYKSSNDKVGVDGRVLAESATPKVNGYGFVATPQIHPGKSAYALPTHPHTHTHTHTHI